MSAASSSGDFRKPPDSAGRPDARRTLHQPVLLRETLTFLDLGPGLRIADGTVGAGGHSQRIFEQIQPKGRLVGLDRDPEMLARAADVLTGDHVTLVNSSYTQLRHVLDDRHVDFVDRVLLDLGLSSDQLADDRRGFSFDSDGPLDLRFQPAEGRPASRLLAEAGEDELETIFREFGEEPHSRKIAAAIVSRRKRQPIETARQLAELLRDVLPGGKPPKRHPATRVFQALRIAVNDELRELETMLEGVLPVCVVPGGRAVVLSFHSLEDRLVKNAFRKKDRWENLTPKPITATATEMKINPRSRGAKLRAAVRTG